MKTKIDQTNQVEHMFFIFSRSNMSVGPIPSSVACHKCGRRDGLDAAVENSIWEKIAERDDGGGFLCLWCMDEIASEKGLSDVPVRLYFAGKALFSVPVDQFRDKEWSECCQEQ